MKYPQNQFDLLVKGLRVLIAIYGLTKEQCLVRWMLHDLHFRTFVNYTYPIENGNVKLDSDGNRILPLTESFELYPNNCVDDNIETAMKKAINLIF